MSRATVSASALPKAAKDFYDVYVLAREFAFDGAPGDSLNHGDIRASDDTDQIDVRHGRLAAAELETWWLPRCILCPYTSAMTEHDPLAEATGFEWDAGNREKNRQKHAVRAAECEQLFFNRPLVVAQDVAHSRDEPRHYALGRTDTGRRLFVVFTIRGTLIRIISARDMSRKEQKRYDSHA